MANISITLLLTKRTYQTINDLNVEVARSSNYAVIAGENLSTEIEVNYPESYASKHCYVHMRNAKGEYSTAVFDTTDTSKRFLLPDTMTFAGNTVLTFYALDSATGEKTVWCPVIIPVTATGVSYQEVARCSEDVLMNAIAQVADIKTAEALRIQAEQARDTAERLRVSNENNRIDNEIRRSNSWEEMAPQMEQIIADAADAWAAAQTVNDIYSMMSMTLCYDDEGYPCYAGEE